MALKAGTAFVDVQPNIGAGFQGALASKLGPIGKAGGVALAGGIAAGVGGVAALSSIGQTFDDAFDTIRVGTGAVGDDLEALKADFKAALSSVPTDAASAATAIADLNTRTGATGETLQGLAASTLELARVTGEDVGTLVEKTTRTFGDWGVAIEDNGVGALDALFRASQATGPPVSQLADLLVRYGAPLRQFGFGFEQSAALLGKFEQEGVNTELVMGSLRIALGKFAREGEDPVDALTNTFEAIQNTGDAAAANAKAIEVFGARAGPDMAAAIREGRFELGDLFATVADGTETIIGAGQDTEDFREKWTRVKNQVFVALEPLATRFIDALGALFDFIGPKVGPIIDTIAGALSGIGNLFGTVTGGLDEAGNKLGPIVEAFQSAFGFIRDVIGTVFGGARETLEENAGGIRRILEGVAGVFSRLFEVARVIFNALREFWDRWGSTITDVFKATFGIVIDVVGAAFDVLKGLFDVVLGILTGDWSRAWEGVKAVFAGIWDSITGILSGAVDILISLGRGLITNFGDAIRSGLEAVVDLFRNLPGRILEFLAGLPAAMVQLGADLIAGLLQGLGNIVGRIGDSIRNGISGAIDGVKSFFGIGSPSRVMAEQLGLPLAQGIAVGSAAVGRLAGDALTSGIRDAATTASSSATTAFAGVLNGVQPARLSPSPAAASTLVSDGNTGTVIELAEGAVVVNNPAPEDASISVPRELRRLALTFGRS